MAVTIFSPAKINLYLAVTGRRADGYHDLVSVAAPLDFGDELVAEDRARTVPACWPAGVCPGQSPGKEDGAWFSLECDDPAVPVNESNLVLQAARAFSVATGGPVRPAQGKPAGVHFRLTKRIPSGAGLGGGSSNAVAALRALNRLSGSPLPEDRLAEVAAELGSDCALFLKNAPVVMRGRGEHIETLPAAAAARVRGRRILLFKPSFGISTPWAYGQMIAGAPRCYVPAAEAEARLGAWLRGDAPAEELLANNMEGVAFGKFIALPVLLEKLRREFGVVAGMSGSGSACYALLGDSATGGRPGHDGSAGPVHSGEVVTRMKHVIRECWGPQAFVQEARVA